MPSNLPCQGVPFWSLEAVHEYLPRFKPVLKRLIECRFAINHQEVAIRRSRLWNRWLARRRLSRLQAESAQLAALLPPLVEVVDEVRGAVLFVGWADEADQQHGFVYRYPEQTVAGICSRSIAQADRVTRDGKLLPGRSRGYLALGELQPVPAAWND